MDNVEFNKSKVIKYLIWAFGLAYAIQIGAAFIANNGNLVFGRLIIAGMMFVPMLSVLLAGGSLRGMGWDPQLKRNWKLLLIAWLAPAVLTLVGAVLYFLVFPKHFDLSGSYLTAAAGEEVLAQLKAQGLTYPLYVLITAFSSVTYAPLINTVVALGEELGWRGFLYPQLKARFGRKPGWLLGGV
ncbi:MAG: CPBP family intramembrane metalloprotease, partial [Oscillospiraceae bacterium]|nr:CPBP family intramembrane metalloprotease [Oscillospiraceae bacterium]